VRAVVTGGAGFIGSHLVRRLIADGWSVLVLDDLSAGRRDDLDGMVPVVVEDVSSNAAEQAMTAFRADLIVHCAAQVSVARSMAEPDLDWQVNVGGMRRVIAAALGPRARIVFLSSGGAIYGDIDGADESTPPAPRSYYAVHKYVAERYLELSGLPYAIARLSNVYGPGQRTDLEGGVVAIFANALQARTPVTIHGSGEQRRDFVHVVDVVEALSRLSTTAMTGTWNVGTGTSGSIIELLGRLELLYGRAHSVRHATARDGDVIRSRLIAERLREDLAWSAKVDLDAGLRSLEAHR
jgi:UDP-glucose 4-epimerase